MVREGRGVTACTTTRHHLSQSALLNVLVHELLVEIRTQRIVHKVRLLVGRRTSAVLEDNIIVPTAFDLQIGATNARGASRCRGSCTGFVVDQRIAREYILHAYAFVLLFLLGITSCRLLQTFLFDLLQFSQQGGIIIIRITIRIGTVVVQRLVSIQVGCGALLLLLQQLLLRLTVHLGALAAAAAGAVRFDGLAHYGGQRFARAGTGACITFAFLQLLAEVTVADLLTGALTSFPRRVEMGFISLY